MSINTPVITPRERTHAIGSGVLLGLAGMSAYYLPVTKDRFVRNSYDVVKNKAKTNIELLDEAALAISGKKLNNEQKLFLSQLGVSEDVVSINSKVAELKKTLTDGDTVKQLKQKFLENFKDFKKSEALVDPVSIKALQKIRWANFAWGAVIGFVLGNVIGLRLEESKNSGSQV